MNARLAIFLHAALLFAGCHEAPAPPDAEGASDKLRPVKLQLNWFPEVEHGGYYAAKIHGYFAEEGLDVTIVPGGTNVPVIQQVASRQVPFAVANAQEVLVGRGQDADVVALMTPMQHSPRCILVHASSGIRTFADLKNVTLAVGEAQLYVDFLKQHAPLSGVKFVPYSGNVSRFVQDKNFAQQGYITSEPFLAREQGADPCCLMVSDLGFDPYSGLLITHGRLIQDDPDLVERMTRACKRGWRQYLESPAETNQLLLTLNDEMTPEALAYGVEQLRTLCLPDGLPPDQLGRMTADRWQALAAQLQQLDALDDPQVAEQAFWRCEKSD